MSKTLRVVDGQIDFDPNTGLLSTVEGDRKAAQDLAEVVLQVYDPKQNYGSFVAAVVTNQIPYAGDLFLRHYISQAVELLQAKQQEDPSSTADERISDITQLITADDGAGTGGFWLQCATESGGPVDMAVQKPTSLNHLTEGF